jgi:hypothetical protein
MVLQLQAEATSIEISPSYELSKLPVHSPMPSEMRKVHFYGMHNLLAVIGITIEHYCSGKASDPDATASNPSKIHQKATEL